MLYSAVTDLACDTRSLFNRQEFYVYHFNVLACYFKCMMIYIFVDIECSKHIVGMARLDIVGDSIGTIYRDQMGAAMDGINVNNCEVGCMVG